jgi:SAM-dependent methyltransferase
VAKSGRSRWPLWLTAAVAAAGVAGGVVVVRPLVGTPLPRILDALRLRGDDVLLEIGPDGGASIAMALEVVERAAAIDDSQEVVDAICRRNVAALAAGRLDVRLGDAASLPWPDGSFTAVAMNQVAFRQREAGRTFREVHRVLRPGGRVVRRGLRLSGDGELARMLEAAGFTSVDVQTRGLAQHASAVRQ